MMLQLSESIGSQYLPVIYELEEPGQRRLVGSSKSLWNIYKKLPEDIAKVDGRYRFFHRTTADVRLHNS